MDRIAFALPVKEGMVEKGMSFIDEMMTERKDTHHEQHKLHGLQRMTVWLQRTPQQMAVIYLEADDLGLARENRNKSSHEFERWFESMVEEVTGHHPDNFDAELLMDWHHEKGHAKQHHAVH